MRLVEENEKGGRGGRAANGLGWMLEQIQLGGAHLFSISNARGF